MTRDVDPDEPDGARDEADELLSAVNRGDREAFVELLARNREFFQRMARRFEGPVSSADDILSETVVKLLARLDTKELEIESFHSYLARSMRNTGIDMERRHARELAADMTAYGAEPAVEDISERLADADVITSAFVSLPESWRQVLWQSEVLGASTEEVGRRLGISKGALAVLKFRAREGLRQAYLAQHLEHVSDSECRAVLELLPKYVRGKLSAAGERRVKEHLGECDDCTVAVARLQDMNNDMSALLAPVLIVAGIKVPARRGLGAWSVLATGRQVVAASAAAALLAALGVATYLRAAADTAAPRSASGASSSAPVRPWAPSAPSAPSASVAAATVSAATVPRPPRPARSPSPLPSRPPATPRVAAPKAPKASPSSARPPRHVLARTLLTGMSSTTQHLFAGSVVHTTLSVTGPGAQRAVLVLAGGPVSSFTVLTRSAWQCTTFQGAPNISAQCRHLVGQPLAFAVDYAVPATQQLHASIRLKETGQTYSFTASG